MYRPLLAVRALILGHPKFHGGFVLMLAVSVALGIAVLSQERAIRAGTAQAAAPFDLILTAPGSAIDRLLSVVYLQPSDMPLLDSAAYFSVADHSRVDFAAPLAFGDSYGNAPVVGTIHAFVNHLAKYGGDDSANYQFSRMTDAVIGARVSMTVGDQFSPNHGIVGDPTAVSHDSLVYTVVDQLPITGSPWDRAILVPVEGVWKVHALPTGHAPGDQRLGPPFDPQYFPGTPAILVRANEMWANYALRSEFDSPDMMAFFPGAVLAQLHALVADVREVLTVMSWMTQILVLSGVLLSLSVLVRVIARRLGMLIALGASQPFLIALVWTYTMVIVLSGSLLGLVVGFGLSALLSQHLTQLTDIQISAALGPPEFLFLAAFLGVTAILALLPAYWSVPRDVQKTLRM
jgi:putative ABC transport system permease protein